MNAIVIEHVKVSELPEDWRSRLQAAAHARVTVRIEEEPEQTGAQATEGFVTSDPAFGIWRDRADMTWKPMCANCARHATPATKPCWWIPMC